MSIDLRTHITFTGMTPEQLEKALSAKFVRRLEIAAIMLKNEMKVELSSHDNLKGSHDSRESAGGYPFKETGQLAGSVSHNVDTEEMTAKVGSNIMYSKWLQLGTRKMAARPWVTLAWNACKEQIEKLLKGKSD